MENFETGTTTVAVEEGAEKATYSREVTEMMAKEEALDRFEARFEGAILLPTAEKIVALQTLINELGATVDGTDVPSTVAPNSLIKVCRATIFSAVGRRMAPSNLASNRSSASSLAIISVTSRL